MVHKDFNWDKRTWTEDYVNAFEKMKESLVNSIALFFPDYLLPWTLRVDASDVAVGAVLFQTRTLEDGKEVYEPIGFASKKFSATAMKWDAFKKEAYAAFFGVNYLHTISEARRSSWRLIIVTYSGLRSQKFRW